MSDGLKRIISGVIFIPLVLLIYYVGGIGLASFLGLVVLIMGYEYREMLLKKGIELPLLIIALNILVFTTSAFCEFYKIFAALFLIIIFNLSWDLFRNKLNGALIRVSLSCFLAVYSAIFLSSLFRIRQLNDGAWLLIGLQILIWFTDTIAFLTGITIGKKRGILEASPRKSLEGFIGGLAAASAGALLLSLFIDLSPVKIITFALAAGLLGQLGDLFESILKRDLGVKDSSDLIPGHGGVFDRFDSLLIAAPFLYLMLSLLS